MGAMERREARAARLEIAGITAAAALLFTAFAVRAHVRGLATSVAYLAIIATRLTPPAGEVIRYARRAARPPWPKGGFRAATHGGEPAPAPGGAVSAATVRLPAGEVSLLRDERVVRLQHAVVSRALRSLPGVRPGECDLSLFARFSSAAWLVRNLLVAAGSSGRTGAADLAHRLRVVYPVFVAAMRMHATHLGGSHSGRRGHARRGRNRRLRGVGPNGEIVGSLYPESLRIERLRRRAALLRCEASARRLRFRVAEERSRYERYLDAVMLVARSADERYGPADEERTVRSVLDRMARMEQRLPGRA